MYKSIKGIAIAFIAIMLVLQVGINHNIYANDTTLSEEEVKSQIDAINKKESSGMFGFYKYDTEELCKIYQAAQMINNYYEGNDFEKIIYNVEEWILPYENSAGEFGYAIYEMKDGKIEMSQQSIGAETSYNMKVMEGRYEGIDINEVKDIKYVDNFFYSMKLVYIEMENGDEFIVPFTNEKVNEWNSLVSAQVYTIDEFFRVMYRYYDELTEEEMIEWAKAHPNDTSVGNINNMRSVPLSEDVKIVKNQTGGIGMTMLYTTAGIFILGIGIVTVRWKLKQKNKTI